MLQLNIEKAYNYYKKFIINDERLNLLREYNIGVVGSVGNRDWELFAAILTCDKGKDENGSDLVQAEVKSAAEGNGFTYHYYRNSGVKQIDEDKKTSHIFIAYSPSYSNITVRIASGIDLAHIFESWKEDLIQKYSTDVGDIQFRKNVTCKQSVEYGRLIMVIENKEIQQIPLCLLNEIL